jgi:two-component system, OmpR family, phosphate regulon sensor histidine kinase PhoR
VAHPVVFFRWFTGPVKDSDGTVIGSIEVFTDVTRIQMENQLKDEFIASAAHDLKTPVTAIKGFTQMALRLSRKQPDMNLTKQLDMVLARTNELSHLMETLLDMSRLQGERFALNIENGTLQELIYRVLRYFDFDTQRQHRVITVDVPPEPIEVVWDLNRMERVLINLIGNALKFSLAREEVVVQGKTHKSETGQDEIILTVTDFGIGIAPAERERVFERFYRVRETIDAGFKGSGLGLYLARSTVELHGGKIWIEDATRQERGTTIFIIMPCHAPSEKKDI